MSLNNSAYKTNLSKGTGLITETLKLLAVYDTTLSKKDFKQSVLENDTLSKKSVSRVVNILEVFSQRYETPDFVPAQYLQMLVKKGAEFHLFEQLFYVYTCRANSILFDFVQQIYWNKATMQFRSIDRQDAIQFVHSALAEGKTASRWSESMQVRMATYLLSCLKDFKLISETNQILPFFLSETVANYIIHELHFRGFADKQIFQATDWALFGLSTEGVVSVFERLSNTGKFIMQYSGDLLKISWNFKSMQDFIYGTY